jgi:transcriptional regulator with XRE-family HTH domain
MGKADKARRRLPVGRQVRRWRAERQLTLAVVAERSGLNIGFLSQIENDKAAPSLDALAAIADALEVPPAWLLLAEVSTPRMVRAGERPTTEVGNGVRIERADGGLTRGFSLLHIRALPGSSTGAHAHAGEEHHLVLGGRWRMRQGDYEVELGAGDYVAWDGTIPHDAAVVGDVPGDLLVVGRRAEPAV